jgi:hypothetical protein
MSLVRAKAKMSSARRPQTAGPAVRCRRKFLRFFRQGFRDAKYDAWERGYKWEAHKMWEEVLNQAEYRSLLRAGKFSEIAARAIRLESRTNLLFSFEKMALRDAVKSPAGARLFATELYEFAYGKGKPEAQFNRWVNSVERLPRKQTRVVTWPVVTVFGFIARPDKYIFLKPNVTRAAAAEYEYDFQYASRPTWEVYAGLLDFAGTVWTDVADLKPRDLIDIQSFLWVLGSDEYAE